MAELVDAADSKSAAERHPGSSPGWGTINMNFLAKLKKFFSIEPPEMGSVWVFRKTEYTSPFKPLKRFRVIDIKDGWVRIENLVYDEKIDLGFNEFYTLFEPYIAPVEQFDKHAA